MQKSNFYKIDIQNSIELSMFTLVCKLWGRGAKLIKMLKIRAIVYINFWIFDEKQFSKVVKLKWLSNRNFPAFPI